MFKRNLGVSLLFVSMVFFIQCSKDSLRDNPILTANQNPGKGNGGGHTEAAVNNLSFPVISLDGFTINPISATGFGTVYTGAYTGLTEEEIVYLNENGPWYAQKVTGNVWQADFYSESTVDVTFIDWGDVIESSNPMVNKPFRLEVTLYTDITENKMNGYTMAVLANPSSPDEIQGNNTTTYEGNWATVVSSKSAMIIQFLNTGSVPVWDPINKVWTGDGVSSPVNISFAPELNVGGKYIYGASVGGWKPTVAGLYRLTFYLKDGSGINLSTARIGNYAGNDSSPAASETKASAPKIDTDNNITFTDVRVVSKRR